MLLLVRQWTKGGGRCVGDQDVHAPERVADLLESERHLTRLLQLEAEGQALDPFTPDLLDDRCRPVGAAPVGDGAVGALAREPDRNGSTDAAGAAGDHGYATVERARRGRPHQARKSRQSASHIVADSRRLSVSMRSLLPWNISGYSV